MKCRKLFALVFAVQSSGFHVAYDQQNYNTFEKTSGVRNMDKELVLHKNNDTDGIFFRTLIYKLR